MKNKLLLIIDVQQAFINKYTEHIPNLIDEHINNNKYNIIVLGKFINRPDSKFVKDLKWSGCMNQNETEIALRNYKEFSIIKRTAYSMYNNELEKILKENNIETVYLCGLDTDACVLKTAVDLFEHNYDVKVIKNLCASSGGTEYHKYGIKLLERFIGRDNII